MRRVARRCTRAGPARSGPDRGLPRGMVAVQRRERPAASSGLESPRPPRGGHGPRGWSAVCARPVTAPSGQGEAGRAGTPKNRTPGAYPKAEADPGRTPMTLARQGEGVNTWFWTDDLLDELEASFSPERLRTYLTAAEGDRKRALQLYTWNTKISAAFYGPLQGLEITLRNAIHRQLTRCYSAAWYDNPAVGLDLGGAWADRRRENGDRAFGSHSDAGATCSCPLVRLLGVVARVRRPRESGWPQGGLRDDALAAGASSRVSSSHAPDAQAGPSAAERSAATAESDRPSRADLCETLA